MDGPETVIALSAVARNSGPIALILLWGPLKSQTVVVVVGGGGGQQTSFWVPLIRWALKLSSISWPASSMDDVCNDITGGVQCQACICHARLLSPPPPQMFN